MTITTEAPIVVLSTPSCQRCKLVARKLTENGVDFDYVDVTDPENADWAEEMRKRNLNQVPQTIHNGEWIEGFNPGALDQLF